jgi:hypothetical protein
MNRRLLVLLNVAMVLLGCLFAVALVRQLLMPLPLPSSESSSVAPPPRVAAPERPMAPPVAAGAYQVIVSKNLFNPHRSEAQGASVTAGPKPLLHGVVMDGPRSRAYLEDPSVKRIYGYAVGDTVAGGRVQSINGDRVIITRPDGRMEVLLQDPDKPRPEPPTPAGAQPPMMAPPPAAAPSEGAPPALPGAAAPGPADPSRATRRDITTASPGGPR